MVRGSCALGWLVVLLWLVSCVYGVVFYVRYLCSSDIACSGAWLLWLWLILMCYVVLMRVGYGLDFCCGFVNSVVVCASLCLLCVSLIACLG